MLCPATVVAGAMEPGEPFKSGRAHFVDHRAEDVHRPLPYGRATCQVLQVVIVTPAEPTRDIAVPEPRDARPALKHNPAQRSNCPKGQGATKGTEEAQLTLRSWEMFSRDFGLAARMLRMAEVRSGVMAARTLAW